jgi:RPA family protein
MSESDSEDVNRREVAYRLFAAEFEDADLSYAESDEERAPNYVVTPTGARVNRVFVVGVLTEVEQVSEDVVRARVVDPTGAFVVYAGQYQPEALAALESAETPSFVAVTGKARTFSPDDADVVYTSIRPEAVSEVDAETRDRWVVATAEQTVERVATTAAAHERVERGENLREVLEGAGVRPGLAAGIPLALDHYGTTPAYLEAVRELALDAARVVAGDLDSAGDLALAPSDEGDADHAFAADLDVESGRDGGAAPDAEPDTEEADAAEAETAEADAAEADTGESDTTGADTEESDAAQPDSASASESEPESESASESEPASESESEPASETGVETGPAAETPDPGEVAAEAAPEGDESADEGELYELSEAERQEVKENYDVEFSSGTEVPDAGESDIDAPEPDEEASEEAESAEDDEGLGDFDAGDEAFDESQADADTTAEFTEDEYDEPESDAADAEGGEPDLDLEDYVVDLMDELDDGDGALREEVVATAADERDADEGEIEDAIQAALMSGRCYESGDDHLKAI